MEKYQGNPLLECDICNWVSYRTCLAKAKSDPTTEKSDRNNTPPGLFACTADCIKEVENHLKKIVVK